MRINIHRAAMLTIWFIFLTLAIALLSGCAVPEEPTAVATVAVEPTATPEIAPTPASIFEPSSRKLQPGDYMGDMTNLALILGLVGLGLAFIGGAVYCVIYAINKLSSNKPKQQSEQKKGRSDVIVPVAGHRRSSFVGHKEALKKLHSDVALTEKDLESIQVYVGKLVQLVNKWIQEAIGYQNEIAQLIAARDVIRSGNADVISEAAGSIASFDPTLANSLNMPTMTDHWVDKVSSILSNEIGLRRARHRVHWRQAHWMADEFKSLRQRILHLQSKLAWAESSDAYVNAIAQLEGAEARLGYIQILEGEGDTPKITASAPQQLSGADQAFVNLATVMGQEEKAIQIIDANQEPK